MPHNTLSVYVTGYNSSHSKSSRLIMFKKLASKSVSIQSLTSEAASLLRGQQAELGNRSVFPPRHVPINVSSNRTHSTLNLMTLPRKNLHDSFLSSVVLTVQADLNKEKHRILEN